ncbi:glycosyltransferase [Cryptosporangium sp. NPDC048952]|uniref:glycosyltransferase n=1 Tax=Cryptosporangium sp. NPDC048952 TaxID=3363961 RepID=UPI00372028BE
MTPGAEPSYAASLAMAAGVRGRVMPISCGIDLSRFAAGTSGASFRAKHRLDSRPVVTYVGRLDVEKNVDVVIRACAVLGLDAQLLIVGVGAERRRLSALASSLGVPVTFAGFVADCDLPAAYAATDVFVNAGTAELQSLVTLEALASGKPVVAADASALPHLVLDGTTGYLFPPGDAAALADRLRRMVSDPEGRERMGAAARRLAKHHDQDRTIRAFEQLYAFGTDRVALKAVS